MIREQDSLLEGPGFDSRYRQFGGSVLMYSPCRHLGIFVHPISLSPSNIHWQRGRAWKVLQSHSPQFPATWKESKEVALVKYDYVQGVLRIFGSNEPQKEGKQIKDRCL